MARKRRAKVMTLEEQQAYARGRLETQSRIHQENKTAEDKGIAAILGLTALGLTWVSTSPTIHSLHRTLLGRSVRMIRLAGTRASRAVRSTTRCHSTSVSGGISGSTVFTAAVPMTNAAGRCAKGPGPAAPARAASPGGEAARPGACSAPGPIGDGDSSLTAYELVPRPGQRGMPCLRTIEGHRGRIPESIWGTAPYRSAPGDGLSPGPGTARPGPTGRAVAAGAAPVRQWDGRRRGTHAPGRGGAARGSRARRRGPGCRPAGLRGPGGHCPSGRRPPQSGPWWLANGHRRAWPRATRPGCARMRRGHSWRCLPSVIRMSTDRRGSRAVPSCPVGVLSLMLLLAPTLTPLHVRSCSSRSTAWSCTARCGWRSREPRPATSWRRTPITRRDGRMLGLTSPCRHFFSCRAARTSASRAPTDTACAGASGPSRRRSSSVPPAGARMYRERRGGKGG